MGKDFNPGFSFDFGASEEPKGSSWGLAGECQVWAANQLAEQQFLTL